MGVTTQDQVAEVRAGSEPPNTFFHSTVEGTDTVMVEASQAPIVSLVASDSKANDVGKSAQALEEVALVKAAAHPSRVIEVVVKLLLVAKSNTSLISSKAELSLATDKTKVTSSKLPLANVSKPATKDTKAA